MKLSSASRSDIGRVRKHNEDSFWADEHLGLFAVADGMGGHAAGEVASKMALEALNDAILSQKAQLTNLLQNPSDENAEAVRRMLETAVRAATYQVFGMAQVDPSHKGMGTTLSLLLVQSLVAFIAHVGDSRIYVLRQGQVRQATNDHTYVNALIREGKMTPEEAKKSGYSNVLLRAVGSKDYVEVETRLIRCAPGDVFLLCSDGLHGYLSTTDLIQVILPNDLKGSIDRLIDLANQRGGKDNITAVLVRVD